jgi:hypothetical protein
MPLKGMYLFITLKIEVDSGMGSAVKQPDRVTF